MIDDKQSAINFILDGVTQNENKVAKSPNVTQSPNMLKTYSFGNNQVLF